MREQIINALIAHAHGDIAKHKANVEVYLTNPVGIGEHSNVLEAIEQELNMIAKYHDQIEVLNKYFKKKNEVRTKCTKSTHQGSHGKYSKSAPAGMLQVQSTNEV